MSTINFDNQELEAKSDLKLSKLKIIRRSKEKRVTKHVRVSKSNHDLLLEKAKASKMTISKFMDSVCLWYFKSGY